MIIPSEIRDKIIEAFEDHRPSLYRVIVERDEYNRNIAHVLLDFNKPEEK